MQDLELSVGCMQVFDSQYFVQVVPMKLIFIFLESEEYR
jgi:hypothetical protein